MFRGLHFYWADMAVGTRSETVGEIRLRGNNLESSRVVVSEVIWGWREGLVLIGWLPVRQMPGGPF
jgi:hypothetical protein